MKIVHKDLELFVEVSEGFATIHAALSSIRQEVRRLEDKAFSLKGGVFGELTVIDKVDRFRSDGASETYIPCWRCICTCGLELTVRHKDLIDETITRCNGGTNHE